MKIGRSVLGVGEWLVFINNYSLSLVWFSLILLISIFFVFVDGP